MHPMINYKGSVLIAQHPIQSVEFLVALLCGVTTIFIITRGKVGW